MSNEETVAPRWVTLRMVPGQWTLDVEPARPLVRVLVNAAPDGRKIASVEVILRCTAAEEDAVSAILAAYSRGLLIGHDCACGTDNTQHSPRCRVAARDRVAHSLRIEVEAILAAQREGTEWPRIPQPGTEPQPRTPCDQPEQEEPT